MHDSEGTIRFLLNGRPVFLRGISVHEEEFGNNPARAITPAAARGGAGPKSPCSRLPRSFVLP